MKPTKWQRPTFLVLLPVRRLTRGLKFALTYLSCLAVHQLSADLEQPPDQLVVHWPHYIAEISRNSQPKTPRAWTVEFNLHLYGSGLDLTPARLQRLRSSAWRGAKWPWLAQPLYQTEPTQQSVGMRFSRRGWRRRPRLCVNDIGSSWNKNQFVAEFKIWGHAVPIKVCHWADAALHFIP